MKPLSFKTSLITLFVIIVAIVLYVQFSPSHKQSLIVPSATSTTSGAPLNNQIAINSVTLHQSDQKANYDIQIAYPKITNLPDIGIQDSINQNIYQIIQEDIAEFKSGISGASQVPALAAAGQSTLTINYSTSTPSNIGEIVSFTISQEYYSDGAAHPGHQVNSYTFDLTSGKILTLGSLFTGNYLQALSTYASSTLTTSLGDYADAQMIAEGTTPTADNFKNFLPENDGLHIKFDEYQVAPYVVGSPEIVVPYGVMKDFINPNGPLKSF